MFLKSWLLKAPGCKSASFPEIPFFAFFLLKASWQAQFLKNLTSKSDSIYAKACMRIGDAVGIRWCITGTPAENKMMDYFSLLSFLRAEPFCQQPWFTAHVERLSASHFLLKRSFHR